MTDTHKFSIERLVHYQCCECNRWWSIGDGPTDEPLTCPWCGEFGAVEMKPLLKGSEDD